LTSILRNIALWLLNLVRTKLDPDFEKDLAAYEDKVKSYRVQRAALEAQENTERTAIDGLDVQIKTLQAEKDRISQQILEIEVDLQTIDAHRKTIGENLDAKKKEIDSRTDDDAFHHSMFDTVKGPDRPAGNS
jgi:chromosome segregation ATPase